MDKLPLIEIAEINNHIVWSDNYQDVFSITDMDAGSSEINELNDEKGKLMEPVRLNALLLILVLKGHTNISLDYVPYEMTTHSFTTIMPSHIIQILNVSKDFKAKLLMIDKSFLEEINTAKRSPSMYNYMQLKKNPLTMLTPKEAAHMRDSFELLQTKIRLRTHSFQKEVLQNGFVAFLLELANIMVGKKENMVAPTLTRKEELLNNFFKLLAEHVKEQRVVTFYANELCITPQYLSLILKELTGKTANKWIDEALIMEAKILLKSPNITVQQVADTLNFSDQSTFGKFFKKHIGMPPMEYRKS